MTVPNVLVRRYPAILVAELTTEIAHRTAGCPGVNVRRYRARDVMALATEFEHRTE